MGLGMTVGSLCGAVNAAALVVGYIKGREDNSKPNEARKYSKELMTRVRGKYSTEICAELKRNKISCGEIIDFSYEALNELLEDEKEN